MRSFYSDLIQEYKNLYKEADWAEAGNNGPYHQKETSLRNTAHWIITFAYMYRKTGEKDYQEIVSRFAKSIVCDIESSPNGVVRCFCEGEKSSVNGLIGFAWIIEGLVAAYNTLHEEAILKAAERLYLSQPYNKRVHTWEVVDVDGKNLGTDVAFNHSLWYCLAAAKLQQVKTNKAIELQIQDYLEHVDKHFLIYKNGLISHFDVWGGQWQFNLKMRIKKWICAVTKTGLPWRNWNSVEYERAYHLFSMYAFALLYHLYPDIEFFQSRKFLKIKAYGLDKSNFITFPQMNTYAYGYNSPAYELPLVEYIFGNGMAEEREAECFQYHMKYNWDDRSGKYTLNVPDQETLNARIYEIVQYDWIKEG